MKIKASKLREWNTQFEFSVKTNISGCSVYPLTTKELFSIVGEKAREAYEDLSLAYTKAWGENLLRQEIAKTYQKVNSDNVLVTTGAIEAIFLIMNAIVEPGDEIICFFPSYQALFQVAETCGAKIRWWPLNQENNFVPDMKHLEKSITSKTKAIVINQPQVPTGFVFDQKDCERLIAICRKFNLYLVSDEVARWLYLRQEGETLPAADLYEKAISIGDFSKPFGAGGLRIGWLASHDKGVLEKCIPLRGYTTMSNSAPSECLATLILKNREKILEPRLETARRNYQILGDFVAENSESLSLIKPKGGVTAFVKLENEIDSGAFCRGLIQQENILLVPGDVYAVKDRVRVGFGCRAEVFQKGLEGLERYLAKI